MQLDEFISHYREAATRSGKLAYVDIGEGPPVLFVHGVSMNSALWHRVIGNVKSEFRCIAVDLPLHGRSPPRSDHDYALATLARSLCDLLDAIAIPRVHLVGNDSGGAISQVLAATSKERLISLVLTNCDTRGNIPPPAFVRTVELARAGRMAKSATRWVDNLAHARSDRNIGGGYRNPKYLTDEAIVHYLGPVMGTLEVAREFERFLVDALREDDLVAAEPKLRELDVPTAIVWAANDIFFASEWAHWLARLIPGAREPVFVDDAALYFPDERPELLLPHVLKLWKEAEPRVCSTEITGC